MVRFSLYLLLFIFYSSSSSSSLAWHICQPDERFALLKLNTTINWDDSRDCCTWDGVTCDKSTGHVIGLHFFYNVINGTMTSKSSLFSLRHLQSLTFSRNDVKFDVEAFGTLTQNLTNLKILDISFVDMSLVSLASLANLSSSLTSLKLNFCQLRGTIPGDAFRFLSNLEVLDLGTNNISGKVPWSALNLKRLVSFDLSNNKFEGQIPELLPFQNSSSVLKMLRLDHNELNGVVPKSIFQHSKLEYFDLSSNSLVGAVSLEDLSKLKKLVVLNLSSNKLSFMFNNSAKTNHTFEKLWYISLSSCNITEFPHFLKFSKTLQSLDLSNNRIHGSVPRWLLDMGKEMFVSLNLSHNSLTHIDPFPREFPWQVLQFLDLRSNRFSGPLPIISAEFLIFFSASKNNFSSEISASLCNLTSLYVLDLSYNSLSGKIPQCMGNFSESLSVLDLRRNNLSGSIPTTFANAFWLRNLNLNGNQLEGKLPKSLINCLNLEVLDLGNNVLNDTFPDWLESLPALSVLVLRANRLHGAIGNQNNLKSRNPFAKLRIMDLSNNEFTGTLPNKYIKSFEAMKFGLENMKMGYMGEEYYRDSVTVTMKGLDFSLEKIQTIFTTIDFSRNNFTGEIPNSLGNLISLKGLNLSRNALTGDLPSSLGSLSNLEGLDLSFNELVGYIPVELVDIPWLSFLNLSHNRLEGPIPQGAQFNTFQYESFTDNKGLCGFPLPKQCKGDINVTSTTLDQNDEHSSRLTISWHIVMMGYASGVVIGFSIGYIFLFSDSKSSCISGKVQ